jgi:GNAT superfamily N-acetyltransferase
MIQFSRTTSLNRDFQLLTSLLDKELWATYPEVQSDYAPHNKIERNETVVLAYIEREPVGCGCFKEYSAETVEMKRMFVKEGHRGKKVSSQLLRELETWAKESGFKWAILETGIRQVAAIGLYQKAGYSLTENYDPYIGMPLSRCFRKLL